MDLSTDNDKPLTGVCSAQASGSTAHDVHGKCSSAEDTTLSPHSHQRAGSLATVDGAPPLVISPRGQH